MFVLSSNTTNNVVPENHQLLIYLCTVYAGSNYDNSEHISLHVVYSLESGIPWLTTIVLLSKIG